MPGPEAFSNNIRVSRMARGWSQEQLARRAGIPRPTVSAIETERLVPSARAALALARALECRVEDLFSLADDAPGGSDWAWLPQHGQTRFWQAEVAGRLLRYPVEVNALGELAHDGLQRNNAVLRNSAADPRRTLVLASCDPAAGLLAAELGRAHGIRLLVLTRSSGEALALLRRGLIHVAGLHLVRAGARGGNVALVREKHGTAFSCLHVTHWQEGVTVARGLGAHSLREVLGRELRWVGREPGSGARQCFDELLEGRRQPRRIARDHRSVAEAVRSGWADAGVCLRLASDEAGLPFYTVRKEAYDLFFATSAADDSRIRALIDTVRSVSYRATLRELPGYDCVATGELEEC